MNPSSPDGSEPPPVATTNSQPADRLREHPLWSRAAGRGGMQPPAPRPGRGRGRGAGSAAAQAAEEGNTRYERISLLAQELAGAATGDAAVEEGSDDDPDDEFEPVRDQTDNLSVAESDDEDERPAQRRKPPASATDHFASAAFGTGRACVQEDDEESLASGTSSKRKRTAYQNVFPVSGVRCVGCALANRIAPVESFVNANIGRQSERALWRFSEYVWRTQVCEPARREGVDVPSWGWRDIASHFKLHTTLPTIGRTSMVQTLSAMRFQIEGSLVRNEDGVRSLDKSNAELALKILAAESRERQLLQAERTAPAGGRGRGAGRASADE